MKNNTTFWDLLKTLKESFKHFLIPSDRFSVISNVEVYLLRVLFMDSTNETV